MRRWSGGTSAKGREREIWDFVGGISKASRERRNMAKMVKSHEENCSIFKSDVGLTKKDVFTSTSGVHLN